MFDIYGAIKVLSKEGIVEVDNSILDEIGDILYGLNVNYTIDKVDETKTNLSLD